MARMPADILEDRSLFGLIQAACLRRIFMAIGMTLGICFADGEQVSRVVINEYSS
jgi:hypothetical protein